ncbi:hypothetical protein B0H17DRAFT_1024994 [Mycena rosella]|uniref:Uncharacterized protein n=1 Tax=Mycena rosella TaxID=1033263 RepID=A0AAD7FEV4_MYCRO|nr:hypothetical protein B0H17DRAFT_1024994 [Mycena rosella]
MLPFPLYCYSDVYKTVASAIRRDMASTAHTYCLFFRPLARREGPEVIHSDGDVRNMILQVVNSTWDTGIATGMETLPSIIAPNSAVYRTDRQLATIRHAKNAATLFIWMRAVDIMGQNNPRSARYAVAFFIRSNSPFHVTDLAFMLLRFQDFHVRDCDYQKFKLVSLSYHIDIGGIHGLLLFDGDLRHAYHKAEHRARQNPSKFKSSQFGHPISTWPRKSIRLASGRTR